MVNKMHIRTEPIFHLMFAGIPFLYMLVVVPLGFLVNTGDSGNHYGLYNTQNGRLTAFVI